MQAMEYRGPYRVRMADKPIPEIQHPRDAIVKVTRSCICGSDIHLYHGLVPDTRIGHTFGHEFCGIVEEVGPEVHNLKPGDHVVVPFNIACGQCHYCQQGLFGNCHESNPEATAVGGIFGYSHTAGGHDGGQAQYARVPYADVGPMVIPDWMDIEDAVLLTDVVPTGYQAAEMGGIQKGDTVCIFGAGPIGIIAARSAWLFGAGRVIVIDEMDYRLDFVARYGPAETYNFRAIGDMAVFIKKITDGLGADVCIDAVGGDAQGSGLHRLFGIKMKLEAGSAIPLHWAINSAKKGGTVSIVGVYGPTGNMVPIGNMLNKGLTIRGNQASVKRHLPKLVEHVKAGRIKPKELITHRFALDEIGEAYRIFSDRLDECIKPVLLPNG